MLSGEDQVVITSQGFEGSNASGEVMASSADIGRVCEEILTAAGEGTSIQRQAFVPVTLNYAQEVR